MILGQHIEIGVIPGELQPICVMRQVRPAVTRVVDHFQIENLFLRILLRKTSQIDCVIAH